MSDSSADRVIAQCRAFMEDPSSNYLSSMFQDKIEHLKASDRITEKQALLRFPLLHFPVGDDTIQCRKYGKGDLLL